MFVAWFTVAAANMSTPHEGMVSISAYVPESLRDFLRELGDGNLSSGLRLAMDTPLLTPSGATWIECPCQLPDPEAIDAPEVLATSSGVVACGIGPATLVFDCEASEVYVTAADGELVRPLGLQSLAAWAIALPAAVITIGCRPGAGCHGSAAMPDGLDLWRLAPGLIAVGNTDTFCTLPIRQALQLAAEVVALLAHRVRLQQLAICDLEDTLRAPAAELEEVEA